MSSANVTIHHHASQHRYEAEVPQGTRAVLEYEEREGARVMTHTFVAPQLRGQGIAEALVRAALNDARTAGKKVVPACSYVAGFIQRHPEYHDLVG